jgi:uncharacterized membrane protein YdjX (TVP38/TMEM64 family)
LRNTRLLIIVGAAALCCLLLYFFKGPALLSLVLRLLRAAAANGEQLRQTIAETGPLAPLSFIVAQVLQVLIAPFPGEATGVVGGYLFGAWPGFIYSTVALTLGSALAFSLGHLFEHTLRRKYATTKAYRRFNHLVAKGDFTIPFILFLLPGFPKDLLCYLLGMSIMPLRVFIFIAGVARIPGTLMLSFQGAKVYEGKFQEMFILLLVMISVSLPCYLLRHKIIVLLNRHHQKTENQGQQR